MRVGSRGAISTDNDISQKQKRVKKLTASGATYHFRRFCSATERGSPLLDTIRTIRRLIRRFVPKSLPMLNPERRTKVKILDLCCGAGLASIGYKEIFPYARIFGVDIEDMSAVYPFKFVRMDAFSLNYETLEMFDFIHISPPCQRYSKITPKATRDSHPHLIPNALRLGYASGKPFVVENVPGSTQWLRPNCELKMGGKTRFFHANFPVDNHEWSGANIMSSSYSDKASVFRSWGIPSCYKLGMRDIRQGIPPVFTMHIAMSLLSAAYS